jgi:hypothetical protein
VAFPNYLRHFTGIPGSGALVKILTGQRKLILEKENGKDYASELTGSSGHTTNCDKRNLR